MSTRMIGMKEFRNSLAAVAKAVAKGTSFLVMSRSKPAFVVKSADPYEGIEEVDEDIHMPGWTSVMDFTEGGKKNGIDADELYRITKEFIEKND